MTSIRLLPVVIAAAVALLLLKGIGIVTEGGYVLVGTSVARAASEGGGHGTEGGAEAVADTDATITLPSEPSLVDASPTLEDKAPTLPLEAEAAPAGHVSDAHGEAPAEPASRDVPSNDGETVSPTSFCPPTGGAPAGEEGAVESFDFETRTVECPPAPGVSESGDVLPLARNGDGDFVPMAEQEAATETGQAVVERLGERRDELERREEELEMRLALVEAAEKRLAERTATLEALEARINALVEARETAAKEEFLGLVAMYETMKPKEAATIFDELEMPVLLRVARAIAPRKMAPILAKMDPIKAKDLTAGLAADDPEQATEVTPEDLAALPQIVGQ